VNIGGFIASITGLLLLGLVLGERTHGGSGDYTLTAFKWAFGVQYPIWGIGVVQLLRHRRDARQELRAQQMAASPDLQDTH
jgi:hypothetical protein